ncbi:MAG TPA: type II toxin-antitoxin system VapC family toxin [Candidatus Saccharimonadales bacterium]|nr:type II toxin-antitoxin system VapC family toxin [Candidatus Saccharimonadales bacterium]
MHKTLIDSHVLLWLLYEPKKLGKEASKILQTSNDVLVSMASLFELTLKFNKGKLGASPAHILKNTRASGLDILNIREPHILNMVDVAPGVSDPFDQLIMSQAKTEGAVLLTADSLILKTESEYILDVRL